MSKVFVISATLTLGDALKMDVQVVPTSWTDNEGNKHTVGAIRKGDLLIRETKNGKVIIEQAPKASKKR